MPPEPGDAAHLRDLHDAATLVQRFIAGKTFDDYRADPLLRSGVERQIEIIGEAARRLSDRFRAQHPEVPWRSIIAQRHILAHEYGRIDDSLIWRVATTHIPRLLPLLAPLLPPEP